MSQESRVDLTTFQASQPLTLILNPRNKGDILLTNLIVSIGHAI